MYSLCIILMIIAAVLMCLIVLIQNSKGGGLASSFESSNQIMGVRKTTDFLEKATWSLAGFLVLMSICAAYAAPSGTSAQATGTVMENAASQNAAGIPDFSTPAEGDATELPSDAVENN